jgi:hypothetical protein
MHNATNLEIPTSFVSCSVVAATMKPSTPVNVKLRDERGCRYAVEPLLHLSVGAVQDLADHLVKFTDFKCMTRFALASK